MWEEEPRGYRGRLTDLLLPGVDRIRRMESAGGLPLQRLVGLRLLDVEAGRLRFRLESSPWLRWSRDGAVPAPVVGLALDAALGLSVVSTLEPGDASSSALLSVSHARPPAPGTPSIEVAASVVGRSGDWVLAEALVTDREGRLAVAASHCLRAGAGRPPAAHPPTGEAPPPPEDHAAPDPHRRALPPPDAATPPRNPVAGPLRHEAAGAPLAHLFGIVLADLGEDAAVLRMPASRWIARDGRTVLGGALTLLGDLAMAIAARTGPADGHAVTTLDSRTSFVRTAAPDGRDLVATASVVRRGRRSILASVETRDAADRVLTLASATFAVAPPGA